MTVQDSANPATAENTLAALATRITDAQAALAGLASRIAALETNHSSVAANVTTILSKLPFIGDKLASLESVVAAIREIPGEQQVEGAVGDFLETRLKALEDWASNLGQASHNAFTPAG